MQSYKINCKLEWFLISLEVCACKECRKHGEYDHRITIAKKILFERCHVLSEKCLILTYYLVVSMLALRKTVRQNNWLITIKNIKRY